MNREQLIASLQASDDDNGAIIFDDDRYIDWSVEHHRFSDETEPVTGRSFEFKDEDGDTAVMVLEWAEIERLHKALTLLLLTERPQD